MSDLIALDVAVLPPPDVSARAIALSASLEGGESPPLRLDEEHLPHVTLMQLFARVEELEQVYGRVDDALVGAGPLELKVTGGGQGANSVWLAVEKTAALAAVHERLLEALRGLERPDGGPAAFFEGEGRLRDVLWVTGYRLKSSFHHFEPHLTLGHGAAPPDVVPFTFRVDTVAVCHLGRYCTCRVALRRWTLTGSAA